MKNSLIILIVMLVVLSSTPARSITIGPSTQPDWEPETQVKLGWIFGDPSNPQSTDLLVGWDKWVGDQPSWDYDENRIDPWVGNPAQWYIRIPNLNNDNPCKHFWLSHVYERDNTYEGDRVFTNVSWSPFDTYETIHVGEELFDINGNPTANVFLAAYGRITAIYDMSPNPQYEELWLGVTGSPANSFKLLEVYVMTQCVTSLAPQITITISSGPGGMVVTPGEGEFEINSGEDITLIAQPKPHHSFVGWAGSCMVADANESHTSMAPESDCVIRANFESLLDIIHVDDNASHDPGPNDITVSDPNEDGTDAHPFDCIQEAIEVAGQQAKVLVRDGIYYEILNMMGKNIDVNSFDPNMPEEILAYPIIDANNAGTVITFDQEEDLNCLISGFVLRGGFGQPGAIACIGTSPQFHHCIIVGNRVADPNGDMDQYDSNNAAIFCQNSNSLFENCTIHNNYGGVEGAVFKLTDCNVVIINSILWDNVSAEFIVQDGNDPNITYTDLVADWPQIGNITADPCFAQSGLWVDPNYLQLIAQSKDYILEANDPNAIWLPGDYHLMSMFGRYIADVGWLTDLLNSPCLDAGDPNATWLPEPTLPWAPPGNERINMGAYGGTNQASKMATF